jgi:pentatricopeptide repeat protein
MATVHRVSWRLPKTMLSWAFAAASLLAGIGLLGCGDDCRKKIQSGDFEMSQGNYSRALQLFDQAHSMGGCPDAIEKQKRAREMLDHQKGS